VLVDDDDDDDLSSKDSPELPISDVLRFLLFSREKKWDYGVSKSSSVCLSYQLDFSAGFMKK
jgi:hypothetical protein